MTAIAWEEDKMYEKQRIKEEGERRKEKGENKCERLKDRKKI